MKHLSCGQVPEAFYPLGISAADIPAHGPIHHDGTSKGKTRTRVVLLAGRAPICGEGC